MPGPSKRLPTDFFDRLLSNQSDDQINELLSSLVDEQIAPVEEPAVEASGSGRPAPPATAAVATPAEASGPRPPADATWDFSGLPATPGTQTAVRGPGSPTDAGTTPTGPTGPKLDFGQLLRLERNRTRWERRKRKPKLPKLARPTAPIAPPPPRPRILDEWAKLAREKAGPQLKHLRRTALLFLLPALAAFCLFSWYPMIKGMLISLYHYHPTGVSSFVGFANYARAFQDAMFWRSLAHGLGFCLMALMLGFWPPILLAVFINELRWGKGLLKFLFFLPFLMPTVTAAVLWKWMLDQGFGVVNALVAFLPVENPHIGWLTQPQLALVSLVLLYVWKNTGWALLIYSAALTNVDETLYEEAEIHGASLGDKVWHITLPALRGVLGVMLIITVINTLQLFTEVYIMTNGGPMNATEMIATYIYKQAFFYMDIGYASALSVLLLGMLLMLTVLRLRRMQPEGA